jgi:hypothetical protein
MCLRILEVWRVAALLLAALIPALAQAQDGARPASGRDVVGDVERVDGQRSMEREQEARLRRARGAHEVRRTEAARRREAELARQTETGRLRSDVLRYERRESFLQHESSQSQQALRAPPADPGDHAAIARRGELERHLLDQRQELQQTTTSRDDAMKRLQQLR